MFYLYFYVPCPNLPAQRTTICARDRGLYKVKQMPMRTVANTGKHKHGLQMHVRAKMTHSGLKFLENLVVWTKLKNRKKLVVQFFCLWRARFLAHTVAITPNFYVVCFTLYASKISVTGAKAACRTLMKSTPGLNSINVLHSAFALVGLRQ